MRPPTDDELVARYGSDGDSAALASLVERHWPEAYRLAVRALGDPASAEDAAQEAFIGLARGARKYRPGNDFGAWFRTLVLNAVRDHARAASRRRRYEDEVAAA